MPLDVRTGSAGRGDGDARLDGDLVGVGFHGDLSGLAGVDQPDLDLLPARRSLVAGELAQRVRDLVLAASLPCRSSGAAQRVIAVLSGQPPRRHGRPLD
jgi:hypothetical protein